MQVEAQVEQGAIKLTIAYPRVPNLTYNFKLILTVAPQQANSTAPPLLSKTIFTPETKISVGPFEGGRIYKVTLNVTAGGQEHIKTIFVFVGMWRQNDDSQVNQIDAPPVRPYSQPRHQQVQHNPKAKSTASFSNSEDLMKMVGRSVGITNEKTLDRFLLKGRNCRNAKEFVGRRNSDCLRKKEMLLKGKVILGEVYKQREGMQFFKNDWFMGPFYSYDHNEKQLAQ